MTITGHTGLTGLLGRPVSHSISPLMHNESFRLLELDYAYLCFDVGEEEMEDAVQGLRTLGARGWNCTMPDKQRMCQLCDELSPAAKMIGAVNTVVNENGTLIGHNTDGVGYMMAVKEAGFDIIGEQMTLLGAGGAATAIAVQAALDGVSTLHLFNRKGRSWAHAQKLRDTIAENTSCKVSLFDLADREALASSIKGSRILTNGTSVGMAPNTDACVLEDDSFFHKDLIVSDIIYNPRKTKLLQMAEAKGCATFNGLYMLLFQGAEAFRLWTGKEMPVEQIKKLYFS
jgi:shikimate dehydrogenase